MHYCKSDGTNCQSVTSCTDHDVSSYTNKLGACIYKLDNNENPCTWEPVNTTCIDRKGLCTLYYAQLNKELKSCIL